MEDEVVQKVRMKNIKFVVGTFVFLLVVLSGVGSATITGMPYGGSGNWNITNSSYSATYENEVFTVFGNITISSSPTTGALTLINTTMYVNGNVVNNGTLNVSAGSIISINGTPSNNANPYFRYGAGRQIQNDGGSIYFIDSVFNSSGTYNRTTVTGVYRSGVYPNSFDNEKGNLTIQNSTFYDCYRIILSTLYGPHGKVVVANSSFYGDYLVTTTAYYDQYITIENVYADGTFLANNRMTGATITNITTETFQVFDAVITLVDSTIESFTSGDGSHDHGKLILYNTTLDYVPYFQNQNGAGLGGYLYYHKNLYVTTKYANGSIKPGVNVLIYDDSGNLVQNSISDASGQVFYDYLDNYTCTGGYVANHTPNGSYTISIENKNLSVDLRYVKKELNITYQGSAFNITPDIMRSRAPYLYDFAVTLTDDTDQESWTERESLWTAFNARGIKTLATVFYDDGQYGTDGIYNNATRIQWIKDQMDLGHEVSYHTPGWYADNRDKWNTSLSYWYDNFGSYPENYIFHGVMDYGNTAPQWEHLIEGKGAVSGDSYYILDLLNETGVRYYWEAIAYYWNNAQDYNGKNLGGDKYDWMLLNPYDVTKDDDTVFVNQSRYSLGNIIIYKRHGGASGSGLKQWSITHWADYAIPLHPVFIGYDHMQIYTDESGGLSAEFNESVDKISSINAWKQNTTKLLDYQWQIEHLEISQSGDTVTVNNPLSDTVYGATLFINPVYAEDILSATLDDGVYLIYAEDNEVVLPELVTNQSHNVTISWGSSYNTSLPRLSSVSNPLADITYAVYNSTSDRIYINASCSSCTYNLTIENILWPAVTVKRDGVANTWTTKANLNTAREESIGFSLNGYGYTAGGYGPLATTEKYDDVANTWTAKANMNTARYALTGFSLNYLSEIATVPLLSEVYHHITDKVAYKQNGLVTNGAAQGSTVVPFPQNFPVTPNVIATYSGGESGTLSVSSVSTTSFTLHTGVAGTVSWMAMLKE